MGVDHLTLQGEEGGLQLRKRPPDPKKDRPLTPAHFADFEKCYGPNPDGRSKRRPADSNGAWVVTRWNRSADSRQTMPCGPWSQDAVALPVKPNVP